MKRISYAVMSTLTALVLLFGYRTSTHSKATSAGTVIVGAAAPSTSTTSTPSSAPTTSSASPAPTATSTASSPTTTATSAAPSATATAAKTVTGTAADTRWGPVQVQLTVKNGKITNVSVVEYPNNNGRDQEINANALPILVSETLKAQTAKIDMVSGATYTSEGYLTSLQSALNLAGL